MFMFGVISIGQGFVKSYGGLLTTRFLLGVFEAGMFPGSMISRNSQFYLYCFN